METGLMGVFKTRFAVASGNRLTGKTIDVNVRRAKEDQFIYVGEAHILGTVSCG